MDYGSMIAFSWGIVVGIILVLVVGYFAAKHDGTL